jgi:hypothetical protein
VERAHPSRGQWYAIALSLIGDYRSIKEKIGNAYTIRDHFQRACDLNPRDPTCA